MKLLTSTLCLFLISSFAFAATDVPLQDLQERTQTAIKSKQLVIDIEGGSIIAGFPDQDHPDVFMIAAAAIYENGTIFLGNEALQYGENADHFAFPVVKGVIQDYNGFSELMRHVIHDLLQIDPREYAILFTERALSKQSKREKLTQFAFEVLEVPAMQIAKRSFLTALTASRETALVVNMNFDYIEAVPIYEGHILKNATFILDLGARSITQRLAEDLKARGYGSAINSHMLMDILGNYCYAADDFESELESAEQNSENEVDYQLKDGTVLSLNTEQFTPVETLFQPELFGLDVKSVQALINESILAVPESLRAKLYENIVIAGDMTTFENLESRLQSEMMELAPSENVQVQVLEEGSLASYKGGAIMASGLEEHFITAEEYFNKGVEVISEKSLH